MFNNITTLHWIFIAIAIGFSAAVIYTNIQRNALWIFFEKLIDGNFRSETDAKTLKELGLKGINAYVASRSAEKKHGAGKYVTVLGNKTSGNKLESLMEGESENKYYLSSDETETIIKKYRYVPLSFMKLLLMVLAIIVTFSLCAWITGTVIDEMKTGKVKFEDKAEENEEPEIEEESEEAKKNNEKDNSTENKENDAPVMPTVPSGPSLPTGPKS